MDLEVPRLHPVQISPVSLYQCVQFCEVIPNHERSPPYLMDMKYEEYNISLP